MPIILHASTLGSSLVIPAESHTICLTALLTLFLESAHTVAMILHVIMTAIFEYWTARPPIVSYLFDQPLFALAKLPHLVEVAQGVWQFMSLSKCDRILEKTILSRVK